MYTKFVLLTNEPTLSIRHAHKYTCYMQKHTAYTYTHIYIDYHIFKYISNLNDNISIQIDRTIPMKIQKIIFLFGNVLCL